MHYYQFEIKEWQSNTSHLSLEEEAIYLRLINWYYDSEKPIPKDTATLFRKLRIVEQCDIAQMILVEFFTPLETGEWIHKRCDKAINAFKNKSNKARDSANLRWHGKQNANAMQTHTEPNANHKSLIINQESNIKPKAKALVVCPDDVQESIWNDYLAIRKAQKKPITESIWVKLLDELSRCDSLADLNRWGLTVANYSMPKEKRDELISIFTIKKDSLDYEKPKLSSVEG